ncbi:MAG TPA: hypothetical protein PKX31_00410 [Chitinophagaceae bacterium]|nr:hypothetical protein [Chitinophagaceae bacterium]
MKRYIACRKDYLYKDYCYLDIFTLDNGHKIIWTSLPFNEDYLGDVRKEVLEFFKENDISAKSIINFRQSPWAWELQ